MPSQQLRTRVDTGPRGRATGDGSRSGRGFSHEPGEAASARRGPRPRRTSAWPWVYLKHALKHPWHLVALGGAAALGAATLSPIAILVAVVGIELLVVVIALRLRSFRRYVEARLAEVERAQCAEARAALLGQMGDDQRRELVRLEGIVDRVRDAARTHGASAQLAVEECLRLLASFVRLAIAYRSSRECLATVDRRALDDEVRSLETGGIPATLQARELAQGRLAIARRRAQTWDRSREALDDVAQQLAMIAELVQLTHEQLAAPRDPTGTGEELHRMITQLESSQSTFEELAEFGVEEYIEPRVLDLGRAAAAARGCG